MNIKEKVGDFDYMIYNAESYVHQKVFDHNDYILHFLNIRTGKVACFDFSNGIPEGMEFLKKTEPKYDAKKDFEKLVEIIENSEKMIYIKSDICRGFSPIWRVTISKEKLSFTFDVDLSKDYEVNTEVCGFSFNYKKPLDEIEFKDDQVDIYFKNGGCYTIEFRETRKTRVEIV